MIVVSALPLVIKEEMDRKIEAMTTIQHNPALKMQELPTLELVCKKCTRFAKFSAQSRREAARAAMMAGWVIHNKRVVCPKCPA